MRRRGLSHIEVLIAVAVVAVLLSILVPVAASARARADRRSCMSNMHNVGLASMLYSADAHENFLPMQSGKQSYDDLLAPYVMIKNIWACPAAKGDRAIAPNRAIAANVDKTGPVSTSLVETPANTITFSETRPGELSTPLGDEAPNVTLACETAFRDRNNLDMTATEEALERHSGRGNYAFADGSARSIPPSETIFPQVQWFVKPQPAKDFLPQGLDADDCGRIGLEGRDPVTKN